MGTALRHAEVGIGLTFVQRKIQQHMEVNNVLDLRLSQKAATYKSARVGFILNNYDMIKVSLKQLMRTHTIHLTY